MRVCSENMLKINQIEEHFIYNNLAQNFGNSVKVFMIHTLIHRKSLAVGLLELREGKFNKSSLRLEGSTNFGVLLLLDPLFGVLGVALTLELIKFLVLRIEGVGVPFEDLEVLGDGV